MLTRTRTRGDRPTPAASWPPLAWVPPHGWAIGYTFEHTIYLPGPTNKGGGSPKRKESTGTGKALKKAAPGATKPKQRTSPDPALAEAKGQEQAEYERLRQQRPERKEANRRTGRERRQRAKNLGLCRNCGKPAIPGQTRCITCAENHRQSRRRSDAIRRAAAKEMATTDQADQWTGNRV